MTLSARRAVVVTIVSAATLAVLVGCSPADTPVASEAPTSSPEASEAAPEPTASPTRPAFDELVLSSEGLGTLAFGQPPETDPALSMVVFDPVACTDAVTGEPFGITAGDPLAGGWFVDPAYASPATPESSGQPFGVGINPDASNVLERIDLYTDQIPTDGGVRIGDDRADVVAGHPAAAVVESYLTDIYVITGTAGILQIEVASWSTSDKAEYWDAVSIPDGRVMYIHAVAAGAGVFSVAASGNIAGGCAFG